MKASSKIFGLDVLRAIAILLVVVSHTTYLLFPNTEHAILTLIRAMGAVGVDLFFVLSGFLIGGILLKMIKNNQTKFSDFTLFWKRRWLRTLPNYFTILLINIALGIFLFKELPQNIASYFVFLQNFTHPHPHFFTEAWSLSIEEYAYLLLPLVLYCVVAVLPNKDKSKLFFTTTILVILMLLVLKYNYFLEVTVSSYKQWSASFRKVVIYRLDAIYIGFLGVYLYRKYTHFLMRNKVKLAIFGMLSFIVLHSYIFYLKATPQTHLAFYVFVYLQGVALSLVAIFPYAISLKSTAFIAKIITYISTRSYAIYLVNYSIVLLVIQVVFSSSSNSVLQKIVGVILYVVGTIILSEILFRLVEQPMLRYRNKKFPSS